MRLSPITGLRLSPITGLRLSPITGLRFSARLSRLTLRAFLRSSLAERRSSLAERRSSLAERRSSLAARRCLRAAWRCPFANSRSRASAPLVFLELLIPGTTALFASFGFVALPGVFLLGLLEPADLDLDLDLDLEVDLEVD